MDPNANLREQITIASIILEAEDEPYHSTRLADLVLTMNVWLSRQGFLPNAWNNTKCADCPVRNPQPSPRK